MIIKNCKIKGDILLTVLIFASVAITVIIGLTNWGASMLKNIRTISHKEQAFQLNPDNSEIFRDLHRFSSMNRHEVHRPKAEL